MTTQTLPWYCREVGNRYGAPMGRTSYGTLASAADHSLTIAKLSMNLVDRDYDLGGAYWGHVPGSYIYCCFDDTDGDDGICRYERATTEAQAIEKFGIKPEQLNLHPDLYPCREPVLSLDVHGNGYEVDVTALIKAFDNADDDSSLMMSAQDFCLTGRDAKYSWIYAKEQVEDWHLTDALYSQFNAYLVSCGMDGDGQFERLVLRAMLLQTVALEYLNSEDDRNNLYQSEDGSYYLSIDS